MGYIFEQIDNVFSGIFIPNSILDELLYQQVNSFSIFQDILKILVHYKIY